MRPPIPLHCIDLCSAHAHPGKPDLHGLVAQGHPGIAGACATRLFDVAVAATSDAIEEAGAAVEHLRHLGKLYKCSLAFEDDPAARWNHVSTNIRLAQREGDLARAAEWSQKAVDIAATAADLSSAHYNAAINTVALGTGSTASLGIAWEHLKHSSRLSPRDVGVMHSLATLEYVHLLPASAPNRFRQARRLILEKAQGLHSCQTWKAWSPSPQEKYSRPIIFAVKDAVIYGKAVTVLLPKECRFVLPDRSWQLSHFAPADPPRNDATHLKRAFLATSFAPKSFYMAVAHSLPKLAAWLAHRETTFSFANSPPLTTILVPPMSGPIRTAFRLLLEKQMQNQAYLWYPYVEGTRLVIDTLEMVNWSPFSLGDMPLDTPLDFTPEPAILFARNALTAAGIISMPPFLPQQDDARLTALFVLRNPAVDTRVLGGSTRIVKTTSDALRKLDPRWQVKTSTAGNTMTLRELADVHMLIGIHGASLANMMLCGKLRAVVELTRRDRLFQFLPGQDPQDHYQVLARALLGKDRWFSSPGWSSSAFRAKAPLLLDQAEQAHLAQVVTFAAVAAAGQASSRSAFATDALQRGLRLFTEIAVARARAVSFLRAAEALDPSEHQSVAARALYALAVLAMNDGRSDYATATMRKIDPNLRNDRSQHYGFKMALMKQQSVFDAKLRRESQSRRLPNNSGVVRRIAEYRYGELTYDAFVLNFAKKGIPVVFKNAADSILLNRSFLENSVRALVETCGSVRVAPMQYDSDSTDWANLVQIPNGNSDDGKSASEVGGVDFLGNFVKKTFEDIVNNSDAAGRKGGQPPPPYVVDASIPRLCPQLLNRSGFTMPIYVQDLMQGVQLSSAKEDNELATFRDHWPSLFVGSAGTKSGLHRDSIGSFYQLVLHGKKRWIVYDKAVQHNLRPDCMRRTFRLDPFEEMGAAWRYETILEPGDFLFVPAESPHAVENLEPSLSIAGNFVSNEALAATLAELKMGQGQAPGYSALLKGLLAL
jgi:hypothetical protein